MLTLLPLTHMQGEHTNGTRGPLCRPHTHRLEFSAALGDSDFRSKAGFFFVFFIIKQSTELSVKNILTQLLPNCIRDFDTHSCSICLCNSQEKPTSYSLICRQRVGLFLLQTRSIYIESNEMGTNCSSAANSI